MRAFIRETRVEIEYMDSEEIEQQGLIFKKWMLF